MQFNEKNVAQTNEYYLASKNDGSEIPIFNDSTFCEQQNVSVTDNELVKFINCYTRRGEAVHS